MASIKDLQNNPKETVIDATGGNGKAIIEEANNIPKANSKTTVNLNGIFEQPKGRHKNVVPKSPSQKRVQGGRVQEGKDLVIDATNNSRVAADLSSLPSMTPEEEAYNKEHFVDNPMDEILGDGEDSLLTKYLNDKEEELKTEYDIVERNIKQKDN
jgi:hypothetical protein